VGDYTFSYNVGLVDLRVVNQSLCLHRPPPFIEA